MLESVLTELGQLRQNFQQLAVTVAALAEKTGSFLMLMETVNKQMDDGLLRHERTAADHETRIRVQEEKWRSQEAINAAINARSSNNAKWLDGIWGKMVAPILVTMIMAGAGAYILTLRQPTQVTLNSPMIYPKEQ